MCHPLAPVEYHPLPDGRMYILVWLYFLQPSYYFYFTFSPSLFPSQRKICKFPTHFFANFEIFQVILYGLIAGELNHLINDSTPLYINPPIFDSLRQCWTKSGFTKKHILAKRVMYIKAPIA